MLPMERNTAVLRGCHGWSDEQIGEYFYIHTDAVRRTRKRFDASLLIITYRASPPPPDQDEQQRHDAWLSVPIAAPRAYPDPPCTCPGGSEVSDSGLL